MVNLGIDMDTYVNDLHLTKLNTYTEDMLQEKFPVELPEDIFN